MVAHIAATVSKGPRPARERRGTRGHSYRRPTDRPHHHLLGLTYNWDSELGLRPALGGLFYLNIPKCVKHKEDCGF